MTSREVRQKRKQWRINTKITDFERIKLTKIQILENNISCSPKKII